MNRKMLAAGGALAMGLVTTLGGSAQAGSDTWGAYTMNSGNFSCTEVVHDDGDGGTLSANVSGYEIRPQDDHFRTAYVVTRIVAQEKTYNGSWVDVKYGRGHVGSLGPTIDLGANNLARVNYGGSYNPKMTMRVTGFDDLFRLKVITRHFSDEGALLARLVTREGTCRV